MLYDSGSIANYFLDLADKDGKEITLISGVNQDIHERRIYATKIFNLIACWLGGLAVILLLQGSYSDRDWFSLSDGVLIALISGTTVSILGLFAIVARYLFRQQ